jgi:hypothetical protein
MSLAWDGIRRYRVVGASKRSQGVRDHRKSFFGNRFNNPVPTLDGRSIFAPAAAALQSRIESLCNLSKSRAGSVAFYWTSTVLSIVATWVSCQVL